MNNINETKLKEYITTIENFPINGIQFRDVTTLLSNKDGFKLAIDTLNEQIRNIDYDLIVAIDSRGFLFGSVLGYLNNKGIVLARKPGKLPRETEKIEYKLEYGTDALEICKDDIPYGAKVIIVDDLLATGGTSKAVGDLITNMGGNISCYLFLIELDDLGGRNLLEPHMVKTCVHFGGK